MPIVKVYDQNISFPDNLSPDELQKAVASSAKQLASSNASQSSALDSAVQFLSPVTKAVQKFGELTQPTRESLPYATSPQGLLESGYTQISNLAGKAGEFATEELGRRGVNPYVSALAGLGISSAPDIIAGVNQPVLPEAGKALSSKIGSKIDNLAQEKALDYGRNAAGFTKRFINSDPKLKAANESVKILLDKKVITPLASPETIAERASNLANSSGERIGAFLKEANKHESLLPLDDIKNAFDDLRPKRKGKILTHREENKIINEVQDLINDYAETSQKLKMGSDKLLTMEKKTSLPSIGYDEANELKGVLQQRANYKLNNKATMFDRIVAGKFRELLDDKLEKVSTSLKDRSAYDQFLEDKKVYKAALTAEDPIYNRISSELGNNKMSLTDYILAAGSIGAGNYGQAIALLGGKKLLQQYGASTAATVLNRRLPAVPSLPFNPEGFPNVARQGFYGGAGIGLGFGQNRRQQ